MHICTLVQPATSNVNSVKFLQHPATFFFPRNLLYLPGHCLLATMAPAMRLPTSWKDHSLLQDPPFLDIFFIRKHCLHNTRTKGKRDDWLKNLAGDIHDAPDVTPLFS